MRRFIFSVKEAVELVVNSIKLRDKIAGKVLSRRMKASKIKDILENWINKFGGTYETIKGEFGQCFFVNSRRFNVPAAFTLKSIIG